MGDSDQKISRKIFIVLFGIASMVTLFLPTVSSAAPEPNAAKTGPAVSSAKVEWDKLVLEAKKEGKVVIYASTIGGARDALTKAFRQKYGISLDIIMGRGAEMIAKIESERRAGLYGVDVGLNGLTTFFNSIRPSGLTVPIVPLLTLPEILDNSKWRGGRLPVADSKGHVIVMVNGSAPHLLINTDLVKPEEIKSHQDLLNPKWRGRLAINDPSRGGAGTLWFTFLVTKVMGPEKGVNFMKQLAKHEPVVLRDERLLSEWVARGKYAAAISPDKGNSVQMIRAGAPLAFADLREPRPTNSGSGNVMIYEKAPHPNATKLFVNWLLSREGADVYSHGHGYPSTRLDVSTEGIEPILIPRSDETILGEDFQLAKGEWDKMAAEIFRDLIR